MKGNNIYVYSIYIVHAVAQRTRREKSFHIVVCHSCHYCIARFHDRRVCFVCMCTFTISNWRMAVRCKRRSLSRTVCSYAIEIGIKIALHPTLDVHSLFFLHLTVRVRAKARGMHAVQCANSYWTYQGIKSPEKQQQQKGIA